MFLDLARMLRLTALVLFGSLYSLVLAAESLSDGPYVVQDRDANWVALSIRDGKVEHQPAQVGAEISIPGVGTLPSFNVRVREPSSTSPSAIKLSSKVPMFVVADTHGELEIAVALLRAHKIVDESLHWSFGKGHLAVLGDVFDRGAHQTELLWLLYKLEAEAERAGGALHFILGNHESMVLLGDDRYLHAKYKEATKLIGAPHYAALWSDKTLLGQWLRTKPSVMKIRDLLFLHGGFSSEAAQRELALEQINATVRDALAARHTLPEPQQSLVSFVMGSNGPLWYRGYFEPTSERHPRRATDEEVGRVLRYYGARTILVGHTAVPTITPLYAGKVIAVQVYPRRDEEGAPIIEGVAIEKGRFFKALVDGSRIELQAGFQPD